MVKRLDKLQSLKRCWKDDLRGAWWGIYQTVLTAIFGMIGIAFLPIIILLDKIEQILSGKK